MKQLSVALIGIGKHMQQKLYPALCECEASVRAVCDLDIERAQEFAYHHNIPKAYQSSRELCENEKVDAVICAANSTAHYEVARSFAAKGIPVFIEKTPCDTRDQARELARLEKENRTLIQTGFNRRFATGYVMAKDIIDKENVFGRKTMFFSKFHAGAYGSERFLLTNHLLHHLDLARFFLGELKDLHLRRVGYDEHRAGFQLDAVSEDGVVVCIQSNSLQDINYPMERVEITGVGHLVVVDNVRSLKYYRPAVDKSKFEKARMRNDADTLCWDLNLGFPFENESLGNEDEIRHFMDVVSKKCKPELTFADSLKSMELLYDVLDLYNEIMK